MRPIVDRDGLQSHAVAANPTWLPLRPYRLTPVPPLSRHVQPLGPSRRCLRSR